MPEIKGSLLTVCPVLSMELGRFVGAENMYVGLRVYVSSGTKHIQDSGLPSSVLSIWDAGFPYL